MHVGHVTISLIVFLHHLLPLYLHPFCIQEQEPPNSYTSDHFLTPGVLYQISQLGLTDLIQSSEVCN